MELQIDSVIIDERLDRLMEPELSGYLTHAYCTRGECEVTFNGHVFTIRRGDCMVIVANKLVSGVAPSEDFEVMVVYVEESFLHACTPSSNYGTRGGLSLYVNPVMRLTEEGNLICCRSFENVFYRMKHPHLYFHGDEMMVALQQLFVDLFECHARIEGEGEVSIQTAQLMRRFLDMLERGDYRKSREVAYYASKLYVTPKYLSEVCKSVSGNSASSWINRYTAVELVHLLRDKSLSLTDIADMFGFSSQSHFSRFVKNNLGQSPIAFRT